MEKTNILIFLTYLHHGHGFFQKIRLEFPTAVAADIALLTLLLLFRTEIFLKKSQPII